MPYLGRVTFLKQGALPSKDQVLIKRSSDIPSITGTPTKYKYLFKEMRTKIKL